MLCLKKDKACSTETSYISLTTQRDTNETVRIMYLRQKNETI